MTETLSHIALRRLNGSDYSDWYTPFDNVSLSLSEENTLIIHAPSVCSELLRTNDIAEFNQHGQFRILGRKDNTINTGGVKVQIEQVEKELKPLLDCPFMITSVPDPKFGERIVLLIEAVHINHEQINESIKKLPPYWRPKQIIRIDTLPLTDTGKPSRAVARQIASNYIDKT